ncbi:peptidyl-prolyl cis-trans isomerase [Burkholderia pseudomallei]|uniref:peptidyl-prolyl cis-trans isomerase n=1 Tax=Burkholderia pseudomallei TaxID=28450 RepID=UPI000A1A2A91|nr:peptidyl-prolyl cis-trans isomerase [Burkholderia pseudomallei]ARL38812.1 hypothetical protein BOC49_21365 [Burkholderia pseudomallei]
MKRRHGYFVKNATDFRVFSGVAISLLVGCNSLPDTKGLPGDAVAMVNGQVISKGQLNAAVQASGSPDTEALRQTIKQRLIARELVRQQAEAQRYDLLPDVRDAMRNAAVDAEVNRYLRDHVHPAPIAEADIRARYDANIAKPGSKEFKARILIVGDDQSAAAVTSALRRGGNFQTLARRYSTAANRNQGGELPWLTFKDDPTDEQTYGLSVPVARAIVRLAPGDLTVHPIAVGEARVFVKLDDVRPTRVIPYQHARPALQRQLEADAHRRATAQLIRKLRDGATIVE